MNAVHELKILPDFYDAIRSGEKTWETRSEEDRHFDVGDVLHLHRWDSDHGFYLDFDILKMKVIYIHRGLGLAPGYCIMSIVPEVE